MTRDQIEEQIASLLSVIAQLEAQKLDASMYRAALAELRRLLKD